MAGENDVKTKTGLMKAMSRALQNEAYYKDTNQFDTRAFQEIYELLRQLNELEQQLLLSAQHILFRGTLAGMTLERIQELIPEVREWLADIDTKERKLAPTVKKGADTLPEANRPAKPEPEKSAANAGAFFAGMEPGKAMMVQVEEDGQRATGADERPIFYYGEHRFPDGERVQLQFTSADKRLSTLHGVYTMTPEDEESVRKAGVIDRSKYVFYTDPDIVSRYRTSLEREREDYRADPAASLDELAAGAGEASGDEDKATAKKAGGGGGKKRAGGGKRKPGEVAVH